MSLGYDIGMAALNIVESVRSLNVGYLKEAREHLEIRTGIGYGSCCVGILGITVIHILIIR